MSTCLYQKQEDYSQFFCSVCNRYFTSVYALQRHTSDYNSSHFFYPCCNAHFDWSVALSHKCHIEENDNTSEKSFPETNDDVNSVDNNDQEKDLEAKEIIDDLLDNTKYRCDNCPATFQRYKNMRAHILRHPTKHNYVCDKCKKHFVTEIALQKHLCFLAGGHFRCSCQNIFTSISQFKDHIGQHRPYYCCYCNKKNDTFNNLINHIRSHTKEKPFSCPVCRHSFRVRESLTLHMRCHSGVKPFQCSKCDYSCSTKWNLKSHEKRHNASQEKKRDFLCAVCGICFTRKQHLRRHIANHSKESMHLCGICGKLFNQSEYLKRHMENHKRESAIGQKCTVCYKELLKGELYQHHIETGHFRFVCDPCGKVFQSNFNLQRHEKSHKK